MSRDGQCTKCTNIAGNFDRLSRAHKRYRQTDGRAMTYSERERAFAFAKIIYFVTKILQNYTKRFASLAYFASTRESSVENMFSSMPSGRPLSVRHLFHYH